ncbi:MAG: hypothetical protein ACPLKX_05065 [Dictyoglomaceae bacterium]
MKIYKTSLLGLKLLIKLSKKFFEKKEETKEKIPEGFKPVIRNRIEGVFGNIKQALVRYESTKRENLARLYSLSNSMMK